MRLLQRFDTFILATDVQPPSSLPPAEWKLGRGRQAIETIRPEATMTLFVKVRYLYPRYGYTILPFCHRVAYG